MGCDFDKRIESLRAELKANKVSEEDINNAVKQLTEFDKERREYVEPEEEETQSENLDEYELFPNVFTNDEQTNFINSFKEWYKEAIDKDNPANNAFVLSGRGGTGKTSSVGIAIQEAIGHMTSSPPVIYATPTNKASKVLKSSLPSGATGSVLTTAQLMSMVLEESSNGKHVLVKKQVWDVYQRKMVDDMSKIEELSEKFYGDNAGIIVIDEASMLSRSVIDSIMEEASRFDMKVLFMGDNVQLPPVESQTQDGASDDSPIFKYPASAQASLKERMRQGEESKILTVTDVLADQVESGDYSLKIPMVEKKDELEFTNNINEAVGKFAEDFKKDPLNTRFIIFNNSANKKYKSLESKLKDAIYGKDRDRYSMHEQLFISGSSFGMNGLSSTYYNVAAERNIDVFSPAIGDEYTVVDSKVKQTKVKTKLELWTKSNGENILVSIPVEFTVETVRAVPNDFLDKDTMKVDHDKFYKRTGLSKLNIDADDAYYDLPVSGDRNITITDINYNNMKKIGGKKGTSLHGIVTESLQGEISTKLDKSLPKVNSAMLINSHQAQGSTYNTVYTDISNTTSLVKGGFLSNKLGSKAMYVATSRPRNKLVMVNAQDITESIATSDNITTTSERDPVHVDIIQIDNKNQKTRSEYQVKDIKENKENLFIEFEGFPYRLTINKKTGKGETNWKTGKHSWEIPSVDTLIDDFSNSSYIVEHVVAEGDGFKLIKDASYGLNRKGDVYEKDFSMDDSKLDGISLAIRYTPENKKWIVIEKTTGLGFGESAKNRKNAYMSFKNILKEKSREDIVKAISDSLSSKDKKKYEDSELSDESKEKIMNNISNVFNYDNGLKTHMTGRVSGGNPTSSLALALRGYAKKSEMAFSSAREVNALNGVDFNIDAPMTLSPQGLVRVDYTNYGNLLTPRRDGSKTVFDEVELSEEELDNVGSPSNFKISLDTKNSVRLPANAFVNTKKFNEYYNFFIESLKNENIKVYVNDANKSIAISTQKGFGAQKDILDILDQQKDKPMKEQVQNTANLIIDSQNNTENDKANKIVIRHEKNPNLLLFSPRGNEKSYQASREITSIDDLAKIFRSLSEENGTVFDEEYFDNAKKFIDTIGFKKLKVRLNQHGSKNSITGKASTFAMSTDGVLDIYYNEKNNFELARVMFHEYIHHITADNGYGGKQLIKNKDAIELYNHVKNNLTNDQLKKFSYAMSNVNEMFAVAIENPEFAGILSSIKYKNKNVFEKLIEIFNQIFNTSVNNETAMSELIRIINDINSSDVENNLNTIENNESPSQNYYSSDPTTQHLKELFPNVDLSEVLSKYKIEDIEESLISLKDVRKIDSTIASYAMMYVDLLDKTTFMNNAIVKYSKKYKIDRESAKIKLAMDMSKYKETNKGFIQKIWDAILSFFSSSARANIVLNMEVSMLSKRFYDGKTSDAIRLTPKTGFSKVDTELTFKTQPFAANVLSSVMNSVESGSAIFTGSAALALQGDVYRKGKDGITDLHDLDIAVKSKEDIDTIKDKIKNEYNIHEIYAFELPESTSISRKLDTIGSFIPKSIVGNVSPKILNKYLSTTSINTSIVTSIGTSVKNIKRFNDYKFSRIISYDIVKDSTGEVVGTYSANVSEIEGTARTKIEKESTTGYKAVVLDLIEDNTKTHNVKYKSENIGEIFIGGAAETFDAKNSLGSLPRDKDVMDFNFFYGKEKIDTEKYGNIKKEFEGKIILSNSGSGKSLASSLSDKVIDGDIILAGILGVVTNDIVKGLKNAENKDDIYKKLADEMIRLKNDGFTILSPSTHPAVVRVADIATVQKDHYTIQESRGSAKRENVINSSINEVKNSINFFIKNTSEIGNYYTLKSNQYLADIMYEDDTGANHYGNQNEPVLTSESKAEDSKVYAESIGFSPLSGAYRIHEKQYLMYQQQSDSNAAILSEPGVQKIIQSIGRFLDLGDELRPSKELSDSLDRHDGLKALYGKLEAKQRASLGSDSGMEFEESQKLDESDFNVGEDLNGFIDKTLENDIPSEFAEHFDDYKDDVKRISEKITDMFESVLPDYSLRLSKYKTEGNVKGKYSHEIGSDDKDRIDILVNPNSKLSTETEIMLHETIHATAKGVLKRKPKLRNRLIRMRDNFKADTLKEFEGDEDAAIAEMMSSMIPNASEDFMPTMKEKYHYIFGKHSDPEEFMAYMLSNPSMMNMGKQLAYDDTQAIDEKKSNTFWGKIKAMFTDMLNNMRQAKNDGDTNVVQEVEKIFNSVVNSRFKYELRKTQSLEDVVSGYIPIPVLNGVARFGAKGYTGFIKAIHKAIGSKLSKKTQKLIKKEFKKIRISTIGAPTFKKTMNALKSLSSIDKFLRSEVVQSIWNQYFNSNVYSPDKSVRDLMRSFERIDSETRTMRASVFRSIKDNLMVGLKEDKNGKYKVTLEDKARVIKDLVIGTGLNKVFTSISSEDFDRPNIASDLDYFKDNISEYLDDKDIEHLDALAMYGRDRKVHIDNQQINVENIVNKRYARSTRNKYKTLSDSQIENIEQYVIIKGLSLLNDKELESVKSIAGNKDVERILKIINSSKSEHDAVFAQTVADTPFFPTLNPMSATPTTIKIGTKKEAKAIGSTIVSNTPVFAVDEKEYFKYTTINYAASLDSGSLEEAGSDVDGYLISNILKKHFSKSKDADMVKNVDAKIKMINKLIESENIKVDSLIPKHNKAGEVVDYIIPFDKNDVYVLQEANNSSLEFMANLAYHYTEKANKSNQKDRILVEIMKHKVSNKEYIKNKDKYMPLSEVRGLNLSDSFHSNLKDIKIPRYLALYLTGARRPSLANLKVSIAGKELFDMSKHENAKNIVGIGEKFLEEVWSSLKQALTLFEPAITVGNFASNMYIAMEDGINPAKFSIDFYNKIRSLEEFTEMVNEYGDMNTKIRSGEIDREDKDYVALYNAIKNSQFYPLYYAGHITPTVDDGEIQHDHVVLGKVTKKFIRSSDTKKHIRLKAEKLSLENGKSIDENMGKARRNYRKGLNVSVNDHITDVFNFIYGQNDSSSKKVAEKVLIYADVASKMVMLDHRAENSKGDFDMDKEVRELGELFVNYSHPASGLEQYVEKVFGFIYLKYLFRSLKGYFTLILRNPAKAIMLHGAEIMSGIEFSSPDDANFKNGPIDALGHRYQGDSILGTAEVILSPRATDVFGTDLTDAWSSK